jgi:hypothetical protein
MAIYFNDAPLTSIKFNGQLLDEFTFNGVQVLSAPTGFDFVYKFDGSAETSVDGDRYLSNVAVGDNPALYYWNKAAQTINDHPFVGYGAVLPVSTDIVPDAIYVDAVNGNDDTGDGSIGSPYQTLDKILSELVSQKPAVSPWIMGYPLKAKNPDGLIPTGSTIYLREGNYGEVEIKEYHNPELVTIKSYPGETATFQRVYLRSCSNWVIDGLRVDRSGLETSTSLISVTSHGYYGSSYDVTVQNCTAIGESNIDAWGEEEWSTKEKEEGIAKPNSGIYSSGLKNIKIINNTIKNVKLCIIASGSNSIIKNNTLDTFIRDGMNPGGDNTIVMYNKVINRIPSTDGNHDDMLQVSVLGSRMSIVGTLIYKNLFIGDYNRANSTSPYIQNLYGGLGQSIGCFDGPYDGWVVANNVIISSHVHAITMDHMRNSIIANNIVLKESKYESTYTPSITLIDKKGDIPEKPITNNIVKNNVVAGSINVPNTSGFNYEIGNIKKDNYSGFELALDRTIFQDYNNFDLSLTPEAVSTIGFDINDSIDVAAALEDQKMKLVSGRGLEFNGVDQYIDTNYVPDILSDFTILIPMYGDGSDQYPRHGCESSLNMCRLVTFNGSDLSVNIGSSESGVIPLGVSDGERYELAVVGEGGICSLYKDGLDLNASFSITGFSPTLNFQIACSNDDGTLEHFMSGIIDYAYFIPKALTLSEIQAHYNNPEKTLYLEAGVLKSDILDQSALDAMEAGNGFAYLMTENEGCNGNLTNICTGTTTAVSGWLSTMHTNVADHSRGIQTALLTLDANGVPTGLASIDVQEFNFIDTKASLENNGLELSDSTGTWELTKIDPVYLFDGTVRTGE